MAKNICGNCGYVYDPARGVPLEMSTHARGSRTWPTIGSLPLLQGENGDSYRKTEECFDNAISEARQQLHIRDHSNSTSLAEWRTT
jgi:hypothetical protein